VKKLGSTLLVRRHLTEGKTLNYNGSMTPPIERRNLLIKNAKKMQIIYLDLKNVNSRKIYCGKPRPTTELTKIVNCIRRLIQFGPGIKNMNDS
jgi:hypothetical protein